MNMEENERKAIEYMDEVKDKAIRKEFRKLHRVINSVEVSAGELRKEADELLSDAKKNLEKLRNANKDNLKVYFVDGKAAGVSFIDEEENEGE